MKEKKSSIYFTLVEANLYEHLGYTYRSRNHMLRGGTINIQVQTSVGEVQFMFCGSKQNHKKGLLSEVHNRHLIPVYDRC